MGFLGPRQLLTLSLLNLACGVPLTSSDTSTVFWAPPALCLLEQLASLPDLPAAAGAAPASSSRAASSTEVNKKRPLSRNVCYTKRSLTGRCLPACSPSEPKSLFRKLKNKHLHQSQQTPDANEGTSLCVVPSCQLHLSPSWQSAHTKDCVCTMAGLQLGPPPPQRKCFPSGLDENGRASRGF